MELWDIYDKDKNVTGRTMVRNDWNMKPGDYHLSVLGVIKRTDGKYLITKRSENKAWAPGCYEVPGGGVIAGETSNEAILREVREETGLDVSAFSSKLALTYRRDNPEEKDNYFVDVYLFEGDFSENDIKLQDGETAAFEITDFSQIEAYGKQDLFLHFNSIKEVFLSA